MATNVLPNRKHNRLPGYDYSNPGCYFVTVCIHNRQQILAQIKHNHVQLMTAGKICQTIWCALPHFYPDIVIDEFIIMPNHIHTILYLLPENKSLSLSTVIGSYKSLTARKYYDWCNSSQITPVEKFWQRSFHDHVIRNERALNTIREYIRLNPISWDKDSENHS